MGAPINSNKRQSKFWLLLGSSFVIAALGTPSLSPLLSVFAASFGYALFWLALLMLDAKRRFWPAVFWFACVQAVQLNWLASTVYMGPFILIVYLFVIFGLGLQFGLMSRWIRIPLGLKQIAALSGFWVLMEWVRLFFLTGFTWNPIGLALSANGYSIQFASLFGIYGLCFWVMWTNLFALNALLEKKRPFLWAVFALLPYVYGGLQQTLVKPTEGKEMEVALVQTALRPEQRDRLSFEVGAHIPPFLQWDRLLSHLQNVEQNQFELIVFPEGTLPGGVKKCGYTFEAVRGMWIDHFGADSEKDFPPFDKPFAEPTKRGEWRVTNSFLAQSLANHYHSEVIIGLEDSENGKVYNAALHFKPGNFPSSRYEKQILIPGGEYIPLSNWRWLVDFFSGKFGIQGSFDAGCQTKVFSGKFPLGIAICLEETHSSIFREIKRAGAELFVSITNDVWFPKTRLPWHHFDHGRIRAAENGGCLLRACNTGVTAAINCFGEPIQIFPVSEEKAGVLFLKLPVQSYSTIYTFLGDLPILLASLGLFVIGLISPSREKKKLP